MLPEVEEVGWVPRSIANAQWGRRRWDQPGTWCRNEVCLCRRVTDRLGPVSAGEIG